MTADGITDDDWYTVHEAVCRIVNASGRDDQVMVAHHTESLFDILYQLETTYGRIPSLISTRADFLGDDPLKAISLQKEALAISTDETSTVLALLSLVPWMIEAGRGKREILPYLERLENLEQSAEDPDLFNCGEIAGFRRDFEALGGT